MNLVSRVYNAAKPYTRYLTSEGLASTFGYTYAAAVNTTAQLYGASDNETIGLTVASKTAAFLVGKIALHPHNYKGLAESILMQKGMKIVYELGAYKTIIARQLIPAPFDFMVVSVIPGAILNVWRFRRDHRKGMTTNKKV
ncbi:MAG: hypothetical protein ACI8Y7_001177 [Candidatus Woesearchaeota archaeon]|jgi:hypothetical protein